MINLLTTIILTIVSFLMVFLFNIANTPEEKTEIIIEQKEYMTGVWVSTIYNLDFPSQPNKPEESIRAELDDIVINCRKQGITDIFFQVRPSADALYYSDIFPPSVYVTGSQDTELSFDILDYVVKKAHSEGIKIHAWINPYRITKSENDVLTSDHIALKNPELTVLGADGNLYFNPGLPEARELILDGVLEILENYDVDGIHIDDYFYPSNDFDDAKAYEKFGDGLTLDGFRRQSVNLLVESIYNAVNDYDDVVFGVSPTGIWANSSDHPEGSKTLGSQSYFDNYADSKKWIEMEIIDYIAPQIYWQIGYDIADYEILVNWWADVVFDTSVDLYIGHASYKEDDGTFDAFEIDRQIELNEKIDEVDGSIFFRYENITN